MQPATTHAAAPQPPVPPATNTPVPPATTSRPAPPPPLFKSGLSSIDKIKQQIAERKKEEALQPAAEKPEEPAALPEQLTPVTKESFARAWDQYLAALQKENKMSLSVIFKNATWNLLNETAVELVLASQHERELFEEERINIIPFMRKNLAHTGFDFRITVNSTIQKTRVFTAEEKFNAMAEQNPLLNDLRNLLALDLEY